MFRVLVGLTLVLSVMGCSETTGTGGAAGDGGEAGTGGEGAGGEAGTGGEGAGGGTAGSGGDPLPCQPTTERCENGTIDPHEPCCEQPVPDQENACDGSESTVNPASCTSIGNPITYRLTRVEVEGDCNAGYDLDGCEGQSCVPTGITPPEGLSGVDNALGGFGPTAAGLGGNLGGLNKAFSDALCGRAEGGTCEGGADDGELCNRDDQCAGAAASCVQGDCRVETPRVEIRLVVDANDAEGCANVTVLTEDEPSERILNLSEDGCLSGRLGTIPVPLLVNGVEQHGSFENTVVRVSVSPAGLSHGLLGATMDADTLVQVLDGVLLTAAVPTSVFDINASTPPAIDASALCNGLSATLRVGGIAE